MWVEMKHDYKDTYKSLSQQFHDNTEKKQYLSAFEFRFLYDIWVFLNVKHKEQISLALKTQN